MVPSTRRTVALAGVVGLALVAAPSLYGSANASVLPASTSVAGLGSLVLKSATDLGPTIPNNVQSVTVVLALRDQAGLKKLLADQATPGSASYHQWLSTADFNARFAPAASAVSTATDFARSNGLSVDSVSSNRTLVKLTGTTAQINAAFKTVEHTVSGGGQTFLTPGKTAVLPTSLASVTASVLGLTTYNAMHLPTGLTTKTAASPYQTYPLGSYGPNDFYQIYDAPSTITGTGQKVAVITSGDLDTVKTDLVQFEDTNGLPHVPLTVVQNGPTSTDTSAQDEYDLDTQYSTGFAPGVDGVVAYNTATLGEIGSLNDFVTQNAVKTGSASYGGCEVINEVAGTIDADDQVFEQGQAQGQSLFVSTGDEGSACSLLINTGTPAGVPDVEYPASSPYVVAVGGTTLTGQDTQPLREISWIGGGGGYSLVEAAPSWQKANLTFQPTLGRGLPDVSLDADSNSGYNVIVSGASTPIGGTSASAPAWNGIWARVLQAHPTVGTAAPALYATTSGLTDITLGTNGLWAATPGYDLSTGLGTADITKLIAAVH